VSVAQVFNSPREKKGYGRLGRLCQESCIGTLSIIARKGFGIMFNLNFLKNGQVG
jgi:hypothetical protein